MTNEDLCELGMPAYILFTSLWMLADREGRLEDRPKRIKAEAMPMWDEICWKDVDKLLELLAAKRFIHRYESGGERFIQISKWKKHQHPHQREAASEIPAPPAARPINKGARAKAQPRHSQGSSFSSTSPVGNGEWVMERDGAAASKDRGFGGKEAAVENAPPPVLQKPKRRTQRAAAPPRSAAKRQPPARDTRPGKIPTGHIPRPEPIPPKRAASPNGATRQLPLPGIPGAAKAAHAPSAPLTSTPERPKAPSGPVDFWPHACNDVGLIRDSLKQLADAAHMRAPDDALLRQVLDAGGGADAGTIHAALVALFKRGKFAAMRSWGFVPLLIRECFEAA